jgi:hypothetical protein
LVYRYEMEAAVVRPAPSDLLTQLSCSQFFNAKGFVRRFTSIRGWFQ